MSEQSEFLAARLDEDERVALAALDKRANGKPEHWRWECADDDEPINVDLAIASNAESLQHCESYRVGLRSAEDYPSSAGPYGHLVLEGEEVRPEDARHIVRWDPARVLREVAAMRALVDIAVESCRDDNLIALAAIWCDHPAYKPEWKL